MATDQPARNQVPPLEQRVGDYLISDDPTRLDAAAIHAYLTQSYWSPQIPRETVQRALAIDPNHGPSRALRERIDLAARSRNSFYP